MVIPNGIKESIQRNPMDNPKISMVKKLWDGRLTEIRLGHIDYFSDDVSTLINAFERIMKGYIEEVKLLSKDDSYVISGSLYKNHDIYSLTDEITRIVPPKYRIQILSRDYETHRKQKIAYRDYTKAYTFSRYNVEYDFSEFCDIYDSVKPIYEAIMDKLFSKEKEYTFDDYNFDEIDR